jgi:Peptidase M66
MKLFFIKFILYFFSTSLFLVACGGGSSGINSESSSTTPANPIVSINTNPAPGSLTPVVPPSIGTPINTIPPSTIPPSINTNITPTTVNTNTRIGKVLLGQSLLFPIEDKELVLVANKAALIMVTLLASDTSITKPSAVLTVENSAGVKFPIDLTPPSESLSNSESENVSFSSTYNIEIPGELISQGVKLALNFNDGLKSPVYEPRIGASTSLVLVTFPVQIGTVTAIVPSLDIGSYITDRLPIQNVTVTSRAPYLLKSVASINEATANWGVAFNAALSEMRDLRILEKAPKNTHYYGFMPKRSFGLAGLGEVRGTSAVGFDFPSVPAKVIETLVHELGHNLSLRHAPCGTSGDVNYPYANATLGAPGRYIWGFTSKSKTLVDPRDVNRHDLMSYCSGNTFSDYNYRRIQVYLSPSDKSVLSKVNNISSSNEQELLLISGNVNNGVVTLRPIKTLMGQAELPEPGSYKLLISNANGSQEYSFSTSELDHDENIKYFAFTIPKPDIASDFTVMEDLKVLFRSRAVNTKSDVSVLQKSQIELASVSENVKTTKFVWQASVYRYFTVTHVGIKRTTLAQDVEGGNVDLNTEKLPLGGHYEISLSDGINTQTIIHKR